LRRVQRFGQPLDIHSYEACLKQIETADYFVLLIGSRVGGWFDEPNKVSITRKEYQVAYELHKKGKLKILAFARAEILAIKDERKELAKFLDQEGIDPGIKAKVNARPSKAASDAAFLIDFLEEVGRNRDTATVATKGGTLPTGNWIHAISSFKDVIEVLRGQVFAGTPVEQAIGRELLRNELLDLLSQVLHKGIDSNVSFPHKRIQRLATQYPIRSNELMLKKTVARADFKTIFALTVRHTRFRSECRILDNTLDEGLFLEFDPQTGGFKETSLHAMLHALRLEVRSLKQSLQGELNLRRTLSRLDGAGPGNDVTVPVAELLELFYIFDRAANIATFVTALVRHLDGGPLQPPTLRPITPVEDDSSHLAKERIERSDAAQYVRSS